MMVESRLARLNEILDSFPKVLIAYSGGVDSACLLYAANQRLKARAVGMIADSPSLPREELEAALVLGAQMGALVEVIKTEEFSNPDYLANAPNRCYFCKSALFEKLEKIALERGFPIIAYGENADDQSDSRPGSRAAAEFQVRAPLKEAGLTKADIRTLSQRWNLSTADKPASPCLSSRIPHGTPVTTEALAKIEAGENAIRKLGFRVFRLRHLGTTARIEFAPDELPRVQEASLRDEVLQAAIKAGFEEAVIDPLGYQGISR
jgi:pyridinium-3,5-biscarboxylic acid mononucleotide sulfurtransferase